MATNKTDKVLNVPTLRFPGCTDEWEILTLGKICDTFEYGMNVPAKEYDGENRYIRITDIDDCSHLYSLLNEVSPDGNLEDKYLVKEGDILFARTGASVGKSYIYRSSDGKLYFAGFLIRAHVRCEYNPFFVFYQTLTSKYSKWVNIMSARSGQPGINSQEYASYQLSVPPMNEQKKLADFLSLIDERIALQSKLIEDLKILKSAIVERLYGQYSSRIRIGTIIKPVSIRNRDGRELEVMSVSNKYGFIAQLEQFEERLVASEDTSNYKVITPGIFAYNPARINVGSIAQYKGDRPCIVSPMYICFECGEQVIGGYLEHFFSTKYFHKEMEKRLEGSVRLCLSFEALCNIPISLPTIEQQQKYAHVVGIISEQISTETGILQAYQKQKLYLLSAMFI